MLTYTIRRLILSIPTLLFIALVIFLLLELAPGDPMAQVPLTVPAEVKELMRHLRSVSASPGTSASGNGSSSSSGSSRRSLSTT